MANAASPTLFRVLAHHTPGIGPIAFSPDGQLFAASGDGTVRLWRVADGAPLNVLDDCDEILRLTFSPDGRELITQSHPSHGYHRRDVEQTLDLWRVADGRLLHTFSAGDSWLHDYTFTPDGVTIATSDWRDPVISLWRMTDGALLHRLTGHDALVAEVAFSPDGTTLASGGLDYRILVWRVADGTLLRPLIGHTKRVSAIVFTPDGATLASAASDETVRLWRVDDGALLHTLTGPEYRGEDMEPTAVALATGIQSGVVRDDDTVRPWHVPVTVIEHPIRFKDGTIEQTWEEQVGEVVWDEPTELRFIDRLAVTSDSQAVAGVVWMSHFWERHVHNYQPFSHDRIRLFRVADGTTVDLCTYDRNGAVAPQCVFSPDGQTLMISGDAVGRLWRVADGVCLHEFKSTGAVAFSPDGRMLALSAGDHTIGLWRLV